MMLLVTWYRLFFLNDNLELKKEITVDQVDLSISFFTTCRLSFSAYEKSKEVVFMFACNINNDTTESHQYALKYEGQTTPEEWSCVIKADINMEEMCVRCKEHAANSALLKDEVVWSVFEYAPDCMLLSLAGTPDLLMVQHLKEVRVIADHDKGNLYKYWVAPLPGFDLETFPFLVSAGAKTFSLINIKERRLEKLINASSYPDAAMEGAYFEVDGTTTTMNFASFLARIDSPDHVCFQWNKVAFHSDF